MDSYTIIIHNFFRLVKKMKGICVKKSKKLRRRFDFYTKVC